MGKRKYDYNFTNENNRNFSNINNRRLSKSIDSFRRTNTQGRIRMKKYLFDRLVFSSLIENEVPLKLEKLPPVDHEPFGKRKSRCLLPCLSISRERHADL